MPSLATGGGVGFDFFSLYKIPADVHDDREPLSQTNKKANISRLRPTEIFILDV